MSYKDKVLSSLRKHGDITQITNLKSIPKSDYIYCVINGNNVLQIGKSSPSNGGRLKKIFKGSVLSKHNKAFICGLYPSLVNSPNEFYLVPLTKEQDKSVIENAIHNDMGISTNIQAATFIDEIGNGSISMFHKFLWERFKAHQRYNQMDYIERLMALELYELVTFGTSRITRSSGRCTSSKQADNLEGNILKCLNKGYLTTIWLMMCNNYFRYGPAHTISNDEFQFVKANYSYIEHGAPFNVYGQSKKKD